MPNFLVELVNNLVADDPMVLKELFMQFILLIGIISFTIFMVTWALSNARAAFKTNPGGGVK